MCSEGSGVVAESTILRMSASQAGPRAVRLREGQC